MNADNTYHQGLWEVNADFGNGAVCRGGTGVPPVNHAQDARATFKLHHYPDFGN